MSGRSSCSLIKCLFGALLLSAALPFGNAQAANFHVVYRFNGYGGGALPGGGLIADKNGNLFGTTETGAMAGYVYKLAPDGTETVLYTFTDGGEPMGRLIADSAGNLFGTTYLGGSYYQGDVYELSPDGTESVLHSFGNGSDGSKPQVGLVADASGNLYGTTLVGGGNSGCDGDGCGTAFKLAPDGTETILHSFAGGGDGAEPKSSLILDSAGNLYGATSSGGNTDCGGSGCGTIFRLAPDGTETIMYAFAGAADGANPAGPLLMDARGDLYGANDSTIFKLTVGGSLKVLHTFAGGHDGLRPNGGLVRDGAGTLYGTTLEGGGGSTTCYDGCGTVFELTSKGVETILHVFNGAKGGAQPVDGLSMDRNGRVFGATYKGGMLNNCRNGCGTVFELTTR